MKALNRWLQEQLLAHRPLVGCLIFAMSAIPLLSLFLGLHAYVLATPDVLAFYRPRVLIGAQWLLAALIAGQIGVVAYCWKRRQSESACRWLALLTVTPTVVALIGLAIGYGLKDTPMGLTVLAAFVMGRALFDVDTLKPSLVSGAALALLNEALVGSHAMDYAPLLNAPMFTGEPLAGWWQFWSRLIFGVSALPFSAMVFFLFGTLGRRRRELEHLVRTDMLTGLANRRTFMSQLEIESHRHARTKRPFCLVMCDVDHFKKINDTWGHPAGDAVLVELGRILRTTTREQIDTAARIGGEEFAVLLPETDLEQAQHVAQKMSGGVRTRIFEFDGHQFHVTQSVGIAQTSTGDGSGAMRQADDNLYRAKREGRDRIVASMAEPAPSCF